MIGIWALAMTAQLLLGESGDFCSASMPWQLYAFSKALSDLAFKYVIVTGASSGLGRGFAEALGARKDVDEVWVIARRTERLVELENTISAKVIPISLDLSSLECIEKYKNMLDKTKKLISLSLNWPA